MATLCAMPLVGGIRESAFPPPETPSTSKTGLVDNVKSWDMESRVRDISGIYAASAEWRYHTAILEEEGNAITRRSAHVRTQTYLDALREAAALVADLLQHLPPPPSYECLVTPNEAETLAPPPYTPTEDLAHARVVVDPSVQLERAWTAPKVRSNMSTMSFQIDFGDSSGFQTRGKKAAKKKAAPVAKFTDNNEGDKKDTGATGDDGSGAGDAGGSNNGGAAGGSGGDDNGDNGGGDDDEQGWGFGGSKKTKKSKKKQEEEEEEERKKKEEEEAAAAAASNAADLSWANDDGGGAGDDDWASGFTKPKDKKKKKKGDDDPPPAVPEPPSASAFQDISLDDAIPKLDFTFDNAETKKTDSGFGSWGKTWDFGSIGADEKKKDTKESTTSFGDNNPWSLGGNKSKSKTTVSSDFDFGNFGATNNISFDTGDLGETKTADDAWGFSTLNKKDKKKNGALDDKKDTTGPEPESKKEETTWGAWGTAAKTKKKEPDSFDWGFGSKKDNKKSLISDITEEPATTGDDDWLNSGWNNTSSKKDKKGINEDLSASIDLTSDSKTGDAAGDDIWSTFGASKKDKKKLIDTSPPPAAPDPPPAAGSNDIWGSFAKKSKQTKDLISPMSEVSDIQHEPEPAVAWDFGLNSKDKRKKRKEMESQGIIFDAFDKPIYPEMESPAEPELEPEPEPDLMPAAEEPKVAWDHGLNSKDKKKKRKEMEASGIKFDVFGDPVYPEPEVIPETNPVVEEEPKKAWDAGLNIKEKRKKRKEMEAQGIKFDVFGDPVYDEPEPAPVAEPVPEPEPEPVKEEPKKPWDAGLNSKDRKKKRKEMEAAGIKFDTFGDPIYPEPEPAVESFVESEVPPEPITSPEPPANKEPEKPWDHGLNSKDKKKKKKEMQAQGILFDAFDQPIYPDPEPINVPQPMPETEPAVDLDPESEPVAIKEPEKPWDFGLNSKDKKKKKKEMQAQGITFDELDQPIYPDPESTPEVDLIAESELKGKDEVEPEKEPEKPWDFGLNSKDKKKKKKEMQAQGITFDEFDQPIYPEPDPIVEPEPEVEAEKEPELPWDHGLTSKDKRKKRKELEAQGVTFDENDQPIYPKPAEEIEPAQAVEPVSEPAKEPELPWDHGLTSKDKRKKRKELEAQGVTFDEDDQAIYPKTTADPEPVKEIEPKAELAKESTVPWDQGLTPKEKRKKRKELEAEGVTFDEDDQAIYPKSSEDPEPIVSVESELKVEKEPVVRWDEGLNSKDKRRKRKELEAQGVTFDENDDAVYPEPEVSSVPTPEPEPEVEKEPEPSWDHGLTPKEKRKKRKELEAEGVTFDENDQAIYPKSTSGVDVEAEPVPEVEEEPKVRWDHNLSPKEKRKRRKELEAEGVTFDENDEAVYPEPAPEVVTEVEPEPEVEKEPELPWDHGLNSKDKKKKRKEMESQGIIFDEFNQPIYPEAESPKVEAEVVEEEAASIEVKEPELPWDHGLTGKEKKKKRKEMEANGIVFEFDQPIYPDTKLADTVDPEPEPTPAVEVVKEPELAWDHGLNSKDKKKKRKEMEAKGIVFDVSGQPIYPEPEPVAAVVEPEPEPEPVKEPEQPWDFGLTPKDKRKKKKEMEAQGITFDTFGEPIYPKTVSPAEPEEAEEAEGLELELEAEAESEPALPWDHGLSSKEKKKKKKEMESQGIKFDSFGDPIYPEADEEAEPDLEPEAETKADVKDDDDGWGSWGLSTKDKKKKEKDSTKKSSLDLLPEDEKDPETVKEEKKKDDIWGSWGIGSKEKKTEKETPKKSVMDLISDIEPAPVTAKTEAKTGDVWAAWGITAKDKNKKKETTTKKSVTELISEAEPAAETSKDDSKSGDIWGTWGLTPKEKKLKEEKDSKKKGLISPATEAPAENKADAEADIWGTFTNSKDKKSTKSKAADGATAKISSPEPKPDNDNLNDLLNDDTWAGLDLGKTKSKKTPVEEKKSSIWGFGTSTAATSKSKREKEKEAKAEKEKEAKAEQERLAQAKKESEEKAIREAEELIREAEAEAEAEAAAAEAEAEEKRKLEAEAKGSKKTKSSKLSKTTKASKDDVQIDILHEPIPTPKSTSSKLTKTISRSSDKAVGSKPDEKKVSTDDYFGSWSVGATSKKTTGKKDGDSKKEITKKGVANEMDTLVELENDLEDPMDDTATSPNAKTTKAMSSKTKAGTTIAERIKALETKNDKGASAASATVVGKVKAAGKGQEVPALDSALSPKEEKKASKTSVVSKSSSQKRDTKAPLSPLPGSFPGAFADHEDLLSNHSEDLDEAREAEGSEVSGESASESESGSESDSEPRLKVLPEPVPTPPAQKSKPSTKSKDGKKSAKSSNKSVALPNPAEDSSDNKPADDLLDLASPKASTSPVDDKKPARRERARVERIGNTTGWGFWSATPPPSSKKRETSSKRRDSATISPQPESKKTKPTATGFVRPKTTRPVGDKEKKEEEKKEASRSSDSDKDAVSKKSDRQAPARGMSFSQFMMGGAPPSAMRTKSTRHSSAAVATRSSSRRASVDANVTSPPPEVAENMNDKAAKLMGAKTKPDRRRSVKEKSQAYVDPYPIDDDDMVMINASGNRALASEPKRSAQTKASAPQRRSSTKPRSKTISGDEEVVMVDGPRTREPIFSGAEDVVNVDRPARMQRGNSTKKATGFLGSFFGGRKAVAEPAQFTDAEETSLPIRTRSSSRRKSVVPDDGGFTTDAPIETDVDNEARRAQRKSRREAQRQAEEEERAERAERERRRKERRDREQADLEARRSRAREQAKRQREEEEERMKQERRERRRQKEAEKERQMQEELELSAAADKRRDERRRLRAQLEAQAAEPSPSKEERQRSYTRDEEDRKRRRERRLADEARRSKDPRRSSALVEEYHESRSGRGKGTAPPANKTSSWIESQNVEPPELPPLEGTVLDPSGEKPRSAEDIESGSRRRRNKYAGMTEAEIEEYRAKRRVRRGEKSHSGGSDEREKRRAARDYDGYAEPVKTFDGRPALIRGDSKRSSFLGRFF